MGLGNSGRGPLKHKCTPDDIGYNMSAHPKALKGSNSNSKVGTMSGGRSALFHKSPRLVIAGNRSLHDRERIGIGDRLDALR